MIFASWMFIRVSDEFRLCGWPAVEPLVENVSNPDSFLLTVGCNELPMCSSAAGASVRV
jgi:hypothetical protein